MKHGYIKRILFERFLQTSSRSALTLIGGVTVLDLMEEHCCGKSGDFVKYQPLMHCLLDHYYAKGGAQGNAKDGSHRCAASRTVFSSGGGRIVICIVVSFGLSVACVGHPVTVSTEHMLRYNRTRSRISYIRLG